MRKGCLFLGKLVFPGSCTQLPPSPVFPDCLAVHFSSGLAPNTESSCLDPLNLGAHEEQQKAPGWISTLSVHEHLLSASSIQALV